MQVNDMAISLLFSYYSYQCKKDVIPVYQNKTVLVIFFSLEYVFFYYTKSLFDLSTNCSAIYRYYSQMYTYIVTNLMSMISS